MATPRLAAVSTSWRTVSASSGTPAPALLGCALLDLSGQQNLACRFERWRGLGPLHEADHVLVEAVVRERGGGKRQRQYFMDEPWGSQIVGVAAPPAGQGAGQYLAE